MTIHPDTRLADLSRTCGLVLLYHSITDQPLAAPQGTVHNVHPVVFRHQLERLTPFFEFVSIDDFVSAPARTGLASVTFDDGYRNVADNAYPILRDLQIPATSFLNPVTLTGQWNWRDKVRYIIEHKLEGEFSRFFPMPNTRGRFYRYSKHPDNNSADIDQALDSFLETRQLSLAAPYPYLTAENLAKLDMENSGSQFCYGNHSMSHYVLSSLGRGQQLQQIEMAASDLAQLPVPVCTHCFSAPFGGSRDVDSHTFELVRKFGYTAILMSRQKLHIEDSVVGGVRVIERLMPRTSDIVSEIVDLLENG